MLYLLTYILKVSGPFSTKAVSQGYNCFVTEYSLKTDHKSMPIKYQTTYIILINNDPV